MGDAAWYKAMGIYHWLLRPYHVVLQSRIQDISHMLHAEHEGLSTDTMRDASTIFVGAASDSRLYTAISNFSHGFLRFPDPFHALSLPEPITTICGPSRTASTRQRALTPKERFAKTCSPRKSFFLT